MGLRLAVLVSGASGMLLPIHVLRRLVTLESVERVHLVVSQGAAKVLSHELATSEIPLAERALGPPETTLLAATGMDRSALEKVVTHPDSALDAPIASGSYRLDGAMVLPCSSGTLGSLASGHASTLLLRAAAVALKEKWPLVLCFRETPLGLVHIENLRRLAFNGAVLLPPIPAFYVGGSDLNRFLDAYTQRLLDCLGVPETLDESLRWSGKKES